MRTLPIRVEPVPGETTDGYIGRLTQAHSIDTADIRRVLLRETGRTAWSATNPQLINALTRLAGLPEGALDISFEEHGMWSRCGHPRWAPVKCARCRPFAEPHAICDRCAGGMTTTSRARTGPLCLEHNRWTFGPLAIDLPAGPLFSHAERTLRGTLWERGITLHTGELNLAAAAVLAWASGAENTTILHARADRLGWDVLQTFEDVLLCAYPEVVKVVERVMTPHALRGVLQVSMSALPQIDTFANAIAQALGSHVNDQLHDFAYAVIGHAHRAVLYAAGLRRTRTAQFAPCPRDRALVVAAGVQRGCLLRHASPHIIRDLGRIRTDGTPRPNATRRSTFELDELALP